MQQVLQEFINVRCKRHIGRVLAMKEAEVDEHLPPEVAKRLRRRIMDAFNEFRAEVEDVCESLDSGEYELNDLFVEKLMKGFEDLLQERERRDRDLGRPRPVRLSSG